MCDLLHSAWMSWVLAPGIHYINRLTLYRFKNYSRLSLSRLRLSRITAYLEEKIWSSFKHRNLTSSNKILWIRGEIAPDKQFLPFPQYFQYIFLTKGVSLHIIQLWKLVMQFVLSSILKIWYVKVRIPRSVSEGPFNFMITRVDCC